MKQISCPSGLAFDIDKQTCDWKGKVSNCDKLDSKWRPPNNENVEFDLLLAIWENIPYRLVQLFEHKIIP